MKTTAKTTAIEKILNKSEYLNDFSFSDDFKSIIINKVSQYGKNKAALKSFFNDLQHGGCISGMISDFIYHHDCKEFYIKHIDDLEAFKQNLEDELGEPIKNRHNLPRYTFVVWLCFEEFCYRIYCEEFEQ